MHAAIDSFSRYLPPDSESSKWGWRLLDAGRQTVAPQAPYPGEGHPLAYRFDADGHRTLDEFQIVYITSGSGVFESASVARTAVHAGLGFLLFPGEWHHYRPDPDSGWSEYWLGFRGSDATRTVRAFFRPEAAIHKVGQAAAMIQLFDQLLHWIRQPVGGKEQILAAHIPLALAFLKSASNNQTANLDSQLVIQAKAEMLRNLEQRTDLQALAQRLGVSYSRLRFTFKKQTGHAPREFENAIKLNRARDLLLREGKSVSETADALGFSSIYYFSRAFKKQFGSAPRDWVHHSQHHTHNRSLEAPANLGS